MQSARAMAIAAIVTVVTVAAGCETVQERIPEEHRGAVTGAGLGAATGAAAGIIFGDDTRSAVLGGLLGALVGGAIGHYVYDRQRTADETARQYDYEPARGTLVSVEDANVAPRTAYPGEDIAVRMTYAVLAPDPDREVPITETRQIRHNGDLVGRAEVRVSRIPGTYTSTIPIRLPPHADRGDYEVIAMVESPNTSDTERTDFHVR